MIFDKLMEDGSRLKAYEELYLKCVDAEREVKINPVGSLGTIRVALEKFVDIISDINGLEEFAEAEDKQEKERITLAKRIDNLINAGYIEDWCRGRANKIRNYGNAVLHDGEVLIDGRKADADDIDDIAVDTLKCLYEIVTSYALGERQYSVDEKERRVFRKDGKITGYSQGYKTEDFVSIGEYEIISRMFSSAKTESVIKAYKCKKNVSIGGKEVPRYAIVKRYAKNDVSDVTQYRDGMAAYVIQENGNRIKKLPILAEEITTKADSKYNYISYRTKENTFPLSRQKAFKKLLADISKNKPEKTVRLEILRDILEILDSLGNITDNISIHHRNLNSECVFLTQEGSFCDVNIVNFEYSKIIDLAEEEVGGPTININDYAKKMQGDQFAPPEVKEATIQFMGAPDWEQVDVYACAKLAVCILADNVKMQAINENLYTYLDEISRNYSYELYTVTKDILQNPYMSRPKISEYLEAVQKELQA